MRKLIAGLSLILLAVVVLSLGMCQKREFVLLPDGLNSVNVRLHSGKEWIVTVRNKDGSATDTMFAANNHQRSNIYLTPKHQLVVIEQGGSDVFFALHPNGEPEPLSGNRYDERDTASDAWRYIGVIIGGKFIGASQAAECVGLLGVGESPYRKRYQVPHFC